MNRPALPLTSEPTALSRRRFLTGTAAVTVGGAATLWWPAIAAQAAERKLTYQFQAQTTGYYCSAAAARMALTARGKSPSQDELASRLHLNSSDGLPSIDNLPPVLNAYTGTSFHHVRQWGGSTQYRAQLDADVRHNVDHGYGVLLNVLYFHRGPSVLVSTSGHYIAVLGYNDGSYLIGDPASSANGPGMWFAKATVCSWQKSYRYVAGVNITGSTPPPPPPPPASSWPTVRQGSTGYQVTVLQDLLRQRGSSIAADGAFGAATKSALVAFQRSARLSADGIAGPNTWSAVVMTVRSGMNGSAVKAVQVALNSNGQRVSVDGAFGPGTKAGVVAFQNAHRLSADGVVGPNTWPALV